MDAQGGVLLTRVFWGGYSGDVSVRADLGGRARFAFRQHPILAAEIPGGFLCPGDLGDALPSSHPRSQFSACFRHGGGLVSAFDHGYHWLAALYGGFEFRDRGRSPEEPVVGGEEGEET